MNNSLLNGLRAEENLKYTENGAVALQSTFSPLLDLFGEIGALRRRSEDDIIDLFMRAYETDKLLALKTLFYARDIRGGLGERRTFRIILEYLAKRHPKDVINNIKIVSEYGRWDDLFCLIGTPAEDAALAHIGTQFADDLCEVAKANALGVPASISLLGKWLPSENASSYKTKALAKKLYTAFGMSPREYRHALTTLRAAINIVETKMSRNEWPEIDYSAVPSTAALLYRQAFVRHDKERYISFLDKVQRGEEKINASTLFPYDIVRHYLNEDLGDITPEEEKTFEAQWNALPDYINGSDKNFLVMADVSGSMCDDNYTPLSTSVGLAIYFAERSKGAFANHFITFTDRPHLVSIPHGENVSLQRKVDAVTKDVGYDTNLEAAFDMVLKTALKNSVPPEEMPTAIVIISDMEINDFGDYGADNTSFTKTMAARFAAAGYIMPTLVYWNVEARQNTFHAQSDDNVRFVSGHSPSVFQGLCEHLGYSAVELMLAVLNDPRYDAVTAG